MPTNRCISEECGNTANGPKGMCWSCYNRIRRYGDTQPRPRGPVRTYGDECQVRGCESPVRARGLCYSHDIELQKSGSLTPGPTARGVTKPGDIGEWVGGLLRRNPLPPECIRWPFSTRPGGHPYWGNKPARKEILLLAAGPPDRDHDIKIEQTCGGKTTGCVNPLHMEWKPFPREAGKPQTRWRRPPSEWMRSDLDV